MKSQKRHELQTNELADRLGHYIERIRPYSRAILVGLAAVVLLALFLLYQANERSARRAASWSDYYEAFASRDADALDEVAKIHSGTEAALWAHQAAGDIRLATGAGLLYSNREEAIESLEKAEVHFAAVEREARAGSMLLTRARFGLAQTYESLSDLQKAREYYERLAKAEPNSAIGKAAQKRYDELSRSEMQEFYVWFEQQEPVFGRPAADDSSLDSLIPDDLDMLPDRPDLSFPGGDFPLDLNARDAEVPLAPSETPAGESEAPAGESEAPAGESEAPAGESEAPADESEAPADESEAPADEPAAAKQGEVGAAEPELESDESAAKPSSTESESPAPAEESTTDEPVPPADAATEEKPADAAPESESTE